MTDCVLVDLLGILQPDALAEVAKGIDRAAVGIGGLDAVDTLVPRGVVAIACVTVGVGLFYSDAEFLVEQLVQLHFDVGLVS